MRTKQLAVYSIAVIGTLLFSCNQADKINELTLPSSARSATAVSTTCDYSAASGTHIHTQDDFTTYTSIFSKTYEPGTNKIIKINTSIIDAYDHAYKPDEITITYKGNNMICFSKNQNDTVANFTLDPTTKKPISAIARQDFDDPSSKGPFQFKYVYGRLSGIRFTGFFYQPHNVYYPYVTIQYQDSKNIHQVYFGGVDGLQKLVYTYDKKTVFDGQCYPDEFDFGFYGFWTFIKQLNLLPELQPHYRVVRAYLYNKEYPGNEISDYSNQQADGSNKLIKYDVAKYSDKSTAGTPSHYTLSWRCIGSQN